MKTLIGTDESSMTSDWLLRLREKLLEMYYFHSSFAVVPLLEIAALILVVVIHQAASRMSTSFASMAYQAQR